MSRLSSHRSALTSRVQPSRLKRRKVLISTAYLCWCRLIYSLLSDRCVSKFLLKPLLQCSLMQLLLQNIFFIPVTCPPNVIGVFFLSVWRGFYSAGLTFLFTVGEFICIEEKVCAPLQRRPQRSQCKHVVLFAFPCLRHCSPTPTTAQCDLLKLVPGI